MFVFDTVNASLRYRTPSSDFDNVTIMVMRRRRIHTNSCDDDFDDGDDDNDGDNNNDGDDDDDGDDKDDNDDDDNDGDENNENDAYDDANSIPRCHHPTSISWQLILCPVSELEPGPMECPMPG